MNFFVDCGVFKKYLFLFIIVFPCGVFIIVIIINIIIVLFGVLGLRFDELRSFVFIDDVVLLILKLIEFGTKDYFRLFN